MHTYEQVVAPPRKSSLHVRESRKKYQLYLGGVLLAFSALVFWAVEHYGPTNDGFALFLVHYGLAISYLVYLVAKKSAGAAKSWSRENLAGTIILLNLFYISCYALNRDIVIFEPSVSWFNTLIVISGSVTLSYVLPPARQTWIRTLQRFLVGVAIVVYLYQVLYTLPFYGFGLVGSIALGIGLHIFVPFLLLVALLCIIRDHLPSVKDRLIVVSGTALSILFVIAFSVEWKHRLDTAEKEINNSVLLNNGLPPWVQAAQKISHDWITLRALKSDMVYTTWDEVYLTHGLGLNRRWWNESQKHDPLVFIATAFKTTSISRADRVKILLAHHPTQHNAEERLWGGDGLSTSSIITDIDVYPSLRMAYTEKYMTVKNVRPGWGLGNTQEAIYTFVLPEGSVVTSLSLWIDGIEEKGILTSREKATNAYRTIVGVESRDPSVVHWKEGNTVTVRVFPCTPTEERRFKIGITTPLLARNGLLYYQSISFEGPSAANAPETVRLSFPGINAPVTPKGFVTNSAGQLTREAKYDPGFNFAIPMHPINDNTFSFDGYTYSVIPASEKFDSIGVKRLYLDINSSWTDTDLMSFRKRISTVSQYVIMDGRRIRLNADNWHTITTSLRTHNFSLFPFHLIPRKDEALIVTKGTANSPHWSDIKNSNFTEALTIDLLNAHPIRVFNLNTAQASYISALSEFRAISLAEGDAETLFTYVNEGIFPTRQESDNQVWLRQSNTLIRREPSTNSSDNTAPDHVMRLFTYNNILRQIGISYLQDAPYNEEIVREASSAYVVTPVSSLIVLETQKDYDRFGIHDSGNSLLNASKNTDGAVPEPHEWMLIVLFALLVLYAARKRIRQQMMAWR